MIKLLHKDKENKGKPPHKCKSVAAILYIRLFAATHIHFLPIYRT